MWPIVELYLTRTALSLERKRADITYWRSKSGWEVDFILGKAEVAIEAKITTQVHKEDLKGLLAFCEEHPHTTAFVVTQDSRARKLIVNDNLTITVLPWRSFLTKLWEGEIWVGS